MKRIKICTIAFLSFGLIAGCELLDDLEIDDIEDLLEEAVALIQTRQQELPPVLINEGDTIIIDNSVTIIDDPSEDLIVEELPDLTVLGFENITDWDIYITYLADGELQAVYVYQGEALLLSYPCLDAVELLSEDDVDPVTGDLVDSFDLTGIDFFNPDDYFCGDAQILTIDPFSVNATAEVIDLDDL